MNGPNAIAVLGVLLMGLGVTGCRSVQRPAVELDEAVVAEQTFEGARIEVTVRLSNPNDIVLPIPMVRYWLTVEGAGTFNVVDDPAVALPPGEERVVTLAAAYRGGEYAWAGRRFELRGMFSYRPPGQLRALLSQYRIPLPVTSFTLRGELGEMDERMSRRR